MLGPQYISPSPEKPGPDFGPSPTKPDTQKVDKIDFLCTVPVISEPESLSWPSPSPTRYYTSKPEPEISKPVPALLTLLSKAAQAILK